MAVLGLLEGQAEALTQRAVELALAGDTAALRLCLERLAPPRKDAPVSFPLPPMSTAKSRSLSGRCAPLAQDPNSKAKRNSGTLAKAIRTWEVSKDMMGFENATAVPCHSLTSTGDFALCEFEPL